MNRRYSMDRDLRTLILKYVRKYEEYRQWYDMERERLEGVQAITCDGMPKAKNVVDRTLWTVLAREKLENSHRARVVRCIDEAKERIGKDGYVGKAKNALANAIWLSCLDGSQYNFEAFSGMIPCERAMFYRYKNVFLNDIKEGLGL